MAENPAEWDDLTRLINLAIQDHTKRTEEGMVGWTLPGYIALTLIANGYGKV